MVDKRKHRFLEGFGIIVIVLALVRCVFPVVASSSEETVVSTTDSVNVDTPTPVNIDKKTLYLADGERPHRIMSVPSYQKAFPDSNNVQLAAATKWGVKPVKNREDAEARKSELVYVGCSPYYYIDPLYS